MDEDRVVLAKLALEEIIAAAGKEEDALEAVIEAGNVVHRTMDEFADSQPAIAAMLFPSLAFLSRARELMGDEPPEMEGEFDSTWAGYRAYVITVAQHALEDSIKLNETIRAAVQAQFGGHKES